MSDPSKSIDVLLGHMRLKAPIVLDEKTTLRIAAAVNARLADIERHSARIDSLAFALLAAMSFAADLDELRRTCDSDRDAAVADFKSQVLTLRAERDQDTRDMFKALDKILESLRDLLDTLREPLPGEKP